MTIPARWAVPLLIKFPDAVELVSTVAPNPGLHVTWMESGAQSQAGMVLLRFEYLQKKWVFVIAEGHGRFIPESDVIGVNSVPLCRLAGEAVQHLGTSEAEGMADDVVCTLCGIDPNDETQ